jgi:SAM-dependent methyltransferase
MPELLIGAGKRHHKQLVWEDRKEWNDLITLDFNADHKPDVVHDIERLPLPFCNDLFDEIHAYDVLEHVGAQGDWRFFFDQWSDFWRILKPGGLFMAISPHHSSPWAWGDPGHTRIVGEEVLTFLHQPNYEKQVGVSPMSDYRFYYKADFDLVYSRVNQGSNYCFVLRAVKPSRIVENL